MTLTNEVWTQLDPHAGRLSRRSARSLWSLIAAFLALVAVGAVAARSGVIAPRIAVPNYQGTSSGGPTVSPASPHDTVLTVHLLNQGHKSFTVTGVGRSYPGFRITATTPTPFVLGPGEIVQVDIAVTVTSCQLPPTVAPLPIRVERFWGTQTVGASDNAGQPDDGWLRAVRDMSCD